MNNLTVSVALCSYDGEKYIAEQLQSIFNQTVKPSEIIICDDCSQDNTVKIINDLIKQTLIKSDLIINSVNLGYIKNFEKAIKLCSGDIIFLSDQDDVWLPQKIEKHLLRYSETDCSLVFSDAFLVDEKLNKYNISLLEKGHTNLLIKENYTELFTILKMKNVATGTTMSFKKNLKKYIFPFSNNVCHDYWITLLTDMSNKKIELINERLVLYRLHDNNCVGVKLKESFLKKKINNFFHQRAIRDYPYKLYRSFYLFSKSNKDFNKAKVNDIFNLYSFWQRRVLLNSCTFRMGFKIIFYDYQNKQYFDLSTGYRKIIMDIFYLTYNIIKRSFIVSTKKTM